MNFRESIKRENKSGLVVRKQDTPLNFYMLLVDGKPLSTAAYRVRDGKRIRHGNFDGTFRTERGLGKFLKENKLCYESGKTIPKCRISIVKITYKDALSKISPELFEID